MGSGSGVWPRSSRNRSRVSSYAGSRCQSGPERRNMPAGMCSRQKAMWRPSTRVWRPLSRTALAAGRPYGPAPMSRTSSNFEQDRLALSAAAAQRGDAATAAAPAQLVGEREDQAQPGPGEWVAERDRAAVDVDALEVDAEIGSGGQHDAREGLVDLPQRDVGRLEPVLCEQLARGLGRTQVQRRVRPGDDRAA